MITFSADTGFETRPAAVVVWLANLRRLPVIAMRGRYKDI